MKLRSALAAVAVAVLLPSGAAVADTVTQRDPAADLVNRTGTGPVFDRGHEIGDITRTVITHGARKVRVRIEHRDLAKVGRIVTSVQVRSSRGPASARHVSLVAEKGDYDGEVTVTDAYGVQVPCPVTHRISYTQETTWLVVPRYCLGRPRWVRVAAGVTSTPNSYVSLFSDTSGIGGSLEGRDPVFSKRVYR